MGKMAERKVVKTKRKMLKDVKEIRNAEKEKEVKKENMKTVKKTKMQDLEARKIVKMKEENIPPKDLLKLNLKILTANNQLINLFCLSLELLLVFVLLQSISSCILVLENQ